LIILGIFAAGFSFILNQKLRTLTATVAVLSLPARTHALPTALHYFSLTTPTDNAPFIFVFGKQHVDWILDISVIILLCIITFVIIAKICRCYKKHRYEFQLYVRIGYQTESVQIHVQTFKLHPEHYEFSAEKYVVSLHISGCLMPHLIIIWPRVRISSTMTNEQYHLPNSVPITWTQARFLRMALRKPYWCLFVTKIGKRQSILSLPIRRWDVGPAPSSGDVHEISVSTRTLYPTLGEAQIKF